MRFDATPRPRNVTIEGIVMDVIVHREPDVVSEEGVPDFFECGALIDTGASDICIDYRIAHALRLRLIDQRTIGTAGGVVEVPVYMGVFEVPVLGWKRLTRFFAPRIDRINYNVLIGRSLLREYLVTFDGPADCCHFVLPDPGPPDDDYAS